jgi:hypothetical protein
MQHRAIAILAVFVFALGGGGCASRSNKDYEEVLMPLQTGSTLHRRVLVRTGPERKSDKKKKTKKDKEKAAAKPEAEVSATPAPEEEGTPPPERFR